MFLFNLTVVLTTLSAFVFEVQALPFVGDKLFRFHKIEMCDFGATPPLVLVSNLTGSGGKNFLTVNGAMDVTRDLNAPLKLINNTTRCNLPDNKCEVVEPFVTTRICDFIYAPILTVFNAFQPPITGCPIGKNIYTFSNVTFDMTLFTVKYQHNFRWLAKLRIYDVEERLVFCTDFDWSMTNMPRRKSRL